jgi:hypothetical protein
MYRKISALVVVATSVFSTVAALADDTTHALTTSAYEYGNYDYYNAAQPATAQTPPVTAASATVSDSGSCNNTAPACETSANAAPSCSCSSGGSCQSCSSGCDTCCDNGCCHEKLPHWLHCCCLKEHCTTVTGWVDGGIMGNAQSPSTHFNGPVTFPDDDRGQFNQVYGILQRTTDLSTNCG